jgi:hypothetical protein
MLSDNFIPLNVDIVYLISMRVNVVDFLGLGLFLFQLIQPNSALHAANFVAR